MDQFDFDHEGLSFRCIVSHDEHMGMPWDEHDGHGSVRHEYKYYGRPEKRAGEVIIYSERGDWWIYDYVGAVKKARAEKWGFNGMDRATMSPGQIAARAALLDMEYCREWLQGSRYWACIEVYRINADGEQVGQSDFLGGIDSGYSREDDDYLRECAAEVAGGFVYEARKAWREALREARQARYWASRDVQTVGA